MTPLDRRLLDELAIHKLAAAYSHAVMKLDARAAAATYHPDGVLSAFYLPDVSGSNAIEMALAGVLDPLRFLNQICSAGIIDVESDKARATWSVSEFLQRRDADGLECCFGVYEDEMTRGAAGWRFAKRSFKPFYRGRIPATGKDYPVPVFQNQFSPWPFLGPLPIHGSAS